MNFPVPPRFHDRTEAGQSLAEELARYGGRTDVLVLALPRGGVPVGYEIARFLQAPLDVMLVRKLGVPCQEELAMGALASGGVRVLNDEIIDALDIERDTLEAVTLRERRELERRELAYGGHRPAAEVAGRTVIVVDDGIATGATMRAALLALRRRWVGRNQGTH